VQAEVREVDTLARYGGEEFVVVLPETSSDGAQNLADRICTAIRSAPFTSEDDDLHLEVTVSIGGAVYPEHGSASRELLQEADRALYRAKNAGRDRWVMAVGTGASTDR
jgi:diguanylate cyclase (GGDEF)-like protein